VIQGLEPKRRRFDLNQNVSGYSPWQPKAGGREPRYRNRMPIEIVEIFEYRPELLPHARR